MRTFALAVIAALLSQAAQGAPAPLPKPDKRKTDAEQLRGTWEEVSDRRGSPRRGAGATRLVVAGDRWTFHSGGRVASTWRVTLDTKKKPRHLDFHGVGKSAPVRLLAIYALKGDSLAFCYNNGSTTRRPADLVRLQPGEHRMVFKRVKKR
jgi:uncharacterized protein (TIGR03067 family)